MTQERKQQELARPTGRATPVLPLRDSQDFAPSAMAIRSLLEGVRAEDARARGAEAVVFWLAERAFAEREEGEAAWWSAPVRWEAERASGEMGLSIAEAEQGLQDSLAAGLVRTQERTPGLFQLAPELLMPLPVLALLDAGAVRGALLAHPAETAPVLSLLRELARRSSWEQEASRTSSWVLTSRSELASAISWSERRLTDALRVAEEAGLLERSRASGLCLRLRPAVFGADGKQALPPAPAAPPSASTSPSVAAAPAGASTLHLVAGSTALTLKVAGHQLTLPPGAILDLALPEGSPPHVRVIQDAEGRSRIQVGEGIDIGPL